MFQEIKCITRKMNVCSWGETYIGETVRNVETRWNEHNMPAEKLNPSKHLNNNITHHFNRSIICKAPVKKSFRAMFYLTIRADFKW